MEKESTFSCLFICANSYSYLVTYSLKDDEPKDYFWIGDKNLSGKFRNIDNFKAISSDVYSDYAVVLFSPLDVSSKQAKIAIYSLKGGPNAFKVISIEESADRITCSLVQNSNNQVSIMVTNSQAHIKIYSPNIGAKLIIVDSESVKASSTIQFKSVEGKTANLMLSDLLLVPNTPNNIPETRYLWTKVIIGILFIIILISIPCYIGVRFYLERKKSDIYKPALDETDNDYSATMAVVNKNESKYEYKSRLGDDEGCHSKRQLTVTTGIPAN